MKRIIINADDCGLTCHVNDCIRDAICKGVISSTSIMVNMNDFDGAVKLYNEYKNQISFGWHINLTEGTPLTYSQVLLDNNFIVENNGKYLFNGQSFRRKKLNAIMRSDIKKELRAQYDRLTECGMEITHVDSHHHIHTAPSMICLIPSLLKELGIKRCRHVKNYGVSFASYLGRQLWTIPFKIDGIRMPDNLGDFEMYYKNPNLRQGSIIELECHPGHPFQDYQNEMKLVYTADIGKWNAKMISYKDI